MTFLQLYTFQIGCVIKRYFFSDNAETSIILGLDMTSVIRKQFDLCNASMMLNNVNCHDTLFHAQPDNLQSGMK